jgi:hypothetical protein
MHRGREELGAKHVMRHNAQRPTPNAHPLHTSSSAAVVNVSGHGIAEPPVIESADVASTRRVDVLDHGAVSSTIEAILRGSDDSLVRILEAAPERSAGVVSVGDIIVVPSGGVASQLGGSHTLTRCFTLSAVTKATRCEFACALDPIHALGAIHSITFPIGGHLVCKARRTKQKWSVGGNCTDTRIRDAGWFLNCRKGCQMEKKLAQMEKQLGQME